MIKGIYVIYDNVQKEASPPHQFNTDDAAKRYFIAGLKDNPSPADYELYSLGYFDNQSLKDGKYDLRKLDMFDKLEVNNG